MPTRSIVRACQAFSVSHANGIGSFTYEANVVEIVHAPHRLLALTQAPLGVLVRLDAGPEARRGVMKIHADGVETRVLRACSYYRLVPCRAPRCP